MPKSRLLSLFLLGLGLLVVGIPGFWLYVVTTTKTLHPDPRSIQSVTNSAPPPAWADPVERRRQVVRASLAQRNLPGLSVAVGVNGNIVWAEGFGLADIESGRPVTPDDRFRIGTASTVLTSAAIGMLADQGRLQLDDEIQKHIPQFPMKQWPVTIRQIMADVAGIKTEDLDDGVLTTGHCDRAADALGHFDTEPLIFQPGTARHFSSFGWVLLSAAVETATAKQLTAFLEDRVFRPLGMQDTVQDSAGKPVPNEATAYEPRFAPNPFLGLPTNGLAPLYKFDYSCYAGANGFLSTPSDLVRFGMAANSGKLLRPDTVQALQTPQRLASGEDTGYGLGWYVKTTALAGEQVRTTGTNGDLWNGSVASLLTIPERGIAVAVTSNITFADTASLAESIAQAFAKK